MFPAAQNEINSVLSLTAEGGQKRWRERND